MRFNETLMAVLVLFCIAVAIVFVNVDASTELTTASNATVSEYVAIGISNNLSFAGIAFGSLNPATLNNNATGNNDSAGQNSSYFVNVSTDSNVYVDTCIKDSYALNITTNDATIPNTNYTWKDVNISQASATVPGLPGTVMLTSYQKTDATNIAPGGVSYYRFWLSVPSAQKPGTYSNSVFFKGVKTGEVC